MHQSLEQVFEELGNESKRHVARTSGLDGMTYLHLIARRGDMACLELITPWVKPLLSKTDSWGRQPLHIAAKFGNFDFALKLLEMGARIDQLDDTERTPIDYYVESQRKDRGDKSDKMPMGTTLFERFMILAIEDRNRRYSNGKTFLHSAIEISDEGTIYKLLQVFDIEARDDDDRTALHYVILAGRSAMAQSLIKGKLCDKDIKAADTSNHDAHNMTPLMMAVKSDLVEVAELLLNWLGLKIAHENDKQDKTMLHHAGGMGIAKCLIGKGWSPLALDPDGRTALHIAISTRNETVALFLLEVDQVQQHPYDNHNESLLVTACKSGASAVVPRLLSKFPDIINVEDEQSHQPPISWACRNSHNVIVKALVDGNQIDVNMAVKPPKQDEYERFEGYTPLHFAVQARSGLCVEQLLRHPNINLGLKARFDQTPLQMARNTDCHETVKLLLQHKQTTDEERMSFIKTFVYCSSSVFYHIISDVLGSFQNKGLVHTFMLWLADDLATTHLPTSLNLFRERLTKGSWNDLSLPYHVAILLDDVDLVQRLREHHVNEDARDEDNWSWVDYARRYDRNNKFASLVRNMPSLPVQAEPTALVSTDLPNSIEITPCRAYGHINCSQAQREIFLIVQTFHDGG
jgi:ankyrin repeat protein